MPEQPRTSRPVALVFESRGAAEGAIGVVRTLGRAGVRVVVVGEDPGLSHCGRGIVITSCMSSTSGVTPNGPSPS